MKIIGIVCEYNPFHLGHEYQIKAHRRLLEADGVICLMSGNFVQRGAPAEFDKWTRATMAVRSGADLVLELPVVYSAQSAMRFAFGAVSLLDALGFVNVLSFGSECGDVTLLAHAAEIVFSDDFARLTALEMKKGVHYPTARSNVLKQHFSHVDPTLLHAPNNILALEYLHALTHIKSVIEPATIKRNHAFAPASKIRELLRTGQDIESLVPPHVADLMTKPYDRNAFDQIVSYQFRRQTRDALKEIADVSEGLENRFLNCAKTSFGAADLAEQVKTKRYTRTRIDRIIVNTLLGITDADTALAPQYARVLCFNRRGANLLNEMGKTARIPIITKTADARPHSPDFRKMLEKDLLATDLYALLTDDKRAGLDFKKSPVYVK